MQGTMVACLSCKTVVWAYDADYGDLRGTCNIFNLPCPKCGTRGNFDGWSLSRAETFPSEVYNSWSAMRCIARGEELVWEPHPYNEWPCEPARPATWHARNEEVPVIAEEEPK